MNSSKFCWCSLDITALSYFPHPSVKVTAPGQKGKLECGPVSHRAPSNCWEISLQSDALEIQVSRLFFWPRYRAELKQISLSKALKPKIYQNYLSFLSHLFSKWIQVTAPFLYSCPVSASWYFSQGPSLQGKMKRKLWKDVSHSFPKYFYFLSSSVSSQIPFLVLSQFQHTE